MASKLNVYFPMINLNPQGWISQFITPVLAKTGKNRDELANLIYDSFPSKENLDNLQNYQRCDIVLL